ncbi:MAG: hypothetical protein ACOC2H_00045 [Spirochaetota bacterium]
MANTFFFMKVFSASRTEKSPGKVRLLCMMTMPFLVLWFLLFLTFRLHAEPALTIDSRTDDISASHMRSMYDYIIVPKGFSVSVLIYSYVARAEIYSFNSENMVQIESRPAEIKLMVRASKNGSESTVQFFELNGTSHDEIIRHGTNTVNSYLRSLSRE